MCLVLCDYVDFFCLTAVVILCIEDYSFVCSVWCRQLINVRVYVMMVTTIYLVSMAIVEELVFVMEGGTFCSGSGVCFSDIYCCCH